MYEHSAEIDHQVKPVKAIARMTDSDIGFKPKFEAEVSSKTVLFILGSILRITQEEKPYERPILKFN